MTQDHPTPEVLESFVNGRLSPPRMRWVSRHLLSGCIRCQASASRLWALKKEAAGHLEGPPAEAGEEHDGYDEVFDRVFQKVAIREDDLSRERSAARLLLDELMQHPVPRQHLLVANSTRFRNPSLCELLIEESHEAGFQDRTRSFELARLATAVAEMLTRDTCGGIGVLHSLRCRAWGQMGNALRLQGNLAASEAAFETVQKWMDEGEVDSLSTARVLDLKASLRKDQRRFAEAGEILDLVLSIYQSLGQWSLLGRTLKQKSMVCGEAGDLEQEMELLRRALEMLDPEEEPRTFLSARHNLIVSLNAAGRSREAYALLFQTRPLYLRMG
jgi:tetratricopeptide (TPR) repeat protein